MADGGIKLYLQAGREVREWTPEPQQCCRNCQQMLEAVENKSLEKFDARFRALIGRVHDCRPAVTPPGTDCSDVCSIVDEQVASSHLTEVS